MSLPVLAPVPSVCCPWYPGARIVVCADDDISTPGNPGRTLAQEAARQAGGWLAVPDFGDERPANGTDFNDLHRVGLSSVLTSLLGASAQATPTASPGGEAALASNACSEWPVPEPLTSQIDGQPYPTDALPPLLRDAIEEAQSFVQSPAALVYRYGPACVRDGKDLKDAFALLTEHGRARLEEDGRRRFVVVNPALYRKLIG